MTDRVPEFIGNNRPGQSNLLFRIYRSGIVLANLLLLSVLGAVLGCISARSELTERGMLSESWQVYKDRFIQGDGRVIDRKAAGISTSEGQSYGMLRAIWVEDREVFDRIWQWTNNNLNAGVRKDSLYAWRWGKRDDGSWGVHEWVSASDADQDIAYTLLLAHRRWKDRRYLDYARAMLKDIWNKETVLVKGKHYLLADDQSQDKDQYRINPSYFAPYEYRLFAEVDGERNWRQLIDDGYEMLEIVSSASRVGLPPNWATIDPMTGEIKVADALINQDGDYAYDAIRVFLRISIDARTSSDGRAREYLKKHLEWLRRYWKVRRMLPAIISGDGIPRVDYESLEQYGAILPGLELFAPETASEIFYSKVVPVYRQGLWGDPDAYYSQNIVWFGLALYKNSLPLRSP